MTVREIVSSNRPMLHDPSRHVRRVDGRIEELVDDMIESMREAGGIGLAAVQIGVPRRVIVVELPVASPDAEELQEGPRTQLHILINPEVVFTSEEKVAGIEGCLSLAGWAGEVERYHSVTVEGLDLQGRRQRIEADGLLARVLQHEIDHLDGVLFIDHIEDTDKIWKVEEEREEATEAAHERALR